MKKLFYTIFIFLLLGVIAMCAWQVAPDVKDNAHAKAERERIAEVIEESTEENESFSHDAFMQLYEINHDLVAYLEFDSGIVSSPVVQGYTNDSYLRTSFEKKEYSTQGTLFMDSNATLNSQHFTIFGHNVYYDDKAMFSPVSKLVSQEEYEKNKTFSLYTSEEKREYEITNVIYFTQDDYLDYDYLQTEFSSPDAFRYWIDYANSRNLIHAEKRITYNDNFVTLQTCRRWNDNTIILVLAVETHRTSY